MESEVKYEVQRFATEWWPIDECDSIEAAEEISARRYMGPSFPHRIVKITTTREVVEEGQS